MEITLRISVRDAVGGIWGAVQVGKGSAGRAHEVIRDHGGELTWEVPASLKGDRVVGPFVQRDSKGAFVYLLWGATAGQPGTDVSRRAKVYLPASSELVGSYRWEVEIAGRGRDGGPACATVPFARAWIPV